MTEMVEFTPAPVRNGGVYWSEDATWTLVNAWGSKFLELNRGNFRQEDWQFVAESVNAVHAFNAKTTRTDIQCKNRMDTVKRKFKLEKYKAMKIVGTEFISDWPFFRKMDELIGAIVAARRVTPVVTGVNNDVPMGISINHTSVLDVQPIMVKLPMKRPHSTLAPASASVEVPVPSVDDSYFRRNYSMIAAATAAEGKNGDNVADSSEEGDDREGLAELARSIKKLGDMYERIERDRQRLEIELEKQKIKFAKKMEIRRMQLFMDTQIQLEKLKRARRYRSQ